MRVVALVFVCSSSVQARLLLLLAQGLFKTADRVTLCLGVKLVEARHHIALRRTRTGCQNFSKVSAIVNSYSTFHRNLGVENFDLVAGCADPL
jgi:hypothetical protein